MTRNVPKPGTAELELIRSALEAIRVALPGAWSVAGTPAPAVQGRRPDALLTIGAPDGAEAVVLIEVKNAVQPRDVARVAEQLAGHEAAAERQGMVIRGAMLVAPFVSPTTRSQLARHGLGWFDLAGNLRLEVDRPAVFLDRVGADRSRFRAATDRQLKSLRGPAAAKVVLELAEAFLPMGVRELAERAGVGVGTSARVLELLDREAVVERNGDGVVTEVRRRSLIERWTRDYQVMAANEVIATLDPRGLDRALKNVRSLDTRVVVTGSAATRAYLPEGTIPVSPLVSLSLYAEDPLDLMDRLGLRAVERGANVLVLRPYDEVVLERSRIVDGTSYAAPAQVVADLLTGPGRSGEEAEQLLAALESEERGWAR